MLDNTKMLARYAVAIAVAYAAGKGLIVPEQAETLTKAIVELGGLLVSAIPALYALIYVDNSPKV